MLKKSILSLFVIFSFGFSLMGAQNPGVCDAKELRQRLITDQVNHNLFLNNRDQWIKYGAILLPTAIVGATILKVFKGGLTVDGGLLSFMGGGAVGIFSLFMTQILSNVQEQRNNSNTRLRAELN